MGNTLKQLADLVRQERDAITAYEALQAEVLAREQADAAKLSAATARMAAIAMRKEALLDDLADDDFETVTVE